MLWNLTSLDYGFNYCKFYKNTLPFIPLPYKVHNSKIHTEHYCFSILYIRISSLDMSNGCALTMIVIKVHFWRALWKIFLANEIEHNCKTHTLWNKSNQIKNALFMHFDYTKQSSYINSTPLNQASMHKSKRSQQNVMYCVNMVMPDCEWNNRSISKVWRWKKISNHT